MKDTPNPIPLTEMRVYDPTQNKYVPLDECVQLEEVQGYTPTMHSEEHGWFAVQMVTNQSSDFDVLPEDVKPAFQRTAIGYGLTEQLLGRLALCEAVGEDVDDWIGFNWAHFPVEQIREEGHEMMADVIEAAYAEGYTPEQVRMAINALDDFAIEPFEVQNPSGSELRELREGVEDNNALKAIFILGAGASGKSKVAKEMFSGLDLKFINQDRHLTRFFQEAGKPLSDIGSDYGLFKKAQALGRKELKHYSQHRLGLVVDMTGWDYSRVESPVQRLRALGYDCYVVMVHTSLETSQRRNRDRERNVPDSYVATAHHGLWKNFPRYLRLFGKDNSFIIRNETETASVVWERDVAPKLRAAALKILARPLRNAAGIKWREAQLAKKQVQPQVVEAASTRLPFVGVQSDKPSACLQESRQGEVTFPGGSFSVEVVGGEEEIRRGLMFRESLSPGSGMLFLFGIKGTRTMHMENMNFPIDIVFLDGGRVVKVVENAQPNSGETYPSEGIVAQVVELAAGSVRDANIKIGDPVHYKVFA